MSAAFEAPYPVNLDLWGRRVLVVGGGQVAARKVAGLLRAGAAVTVVAPDAVAEIAEDPDVRWHQRPYRRGEVASYRLAITATDDPAVNRQVARDGDAANVFVNSADDPANCSFILPAVVRRGDLQLAVSTNGRSPAFASWVRRRLEQTFTDTHARLLEVLSEVRDEVREAHGTTELAGWEPCDRRRADRPGRCRRGRRGARPCAGVARAGRVRLVTVYLVGAGPGDPDLLTLRAASLLARADVIVHDRLIDHRILASAAPWAELIDVGKTPGSPCNSQAEINRILVDRGRLGDTVVRLKGGDPFVFGRGGEEAEVLGAHGIAVEVVPGVSSSIAAPAAAGIPVTMRGVASGVTIVTAHQDPAHRHEERTRLDWDALARSGTTLVVLMGAARARSVSERLIAGGMRPDMPVAVITSATCPDQLIDRTTLALLGEMPVINPSTIVIGEVAALDVTAAVSLAALAAGEPS